MAEIDFIPDDQRVLVLPDEIKDEITKSGIYIPSQLIKEKKETPLTGVVHRAGLGSPDRPMRYSYHDKVLFSEYSGTEVELDLRGVGKKIFRLMNQMDIWGKIVD